ncbi:MFS transporter [Kordiimonas marina]|uniref:MFS transporter n=1 Tax=Kordiimonas marina TaxID=2872312 RepID=UPI001FF65AF2|nr:MFS transporter [Kordiimonas marina]MCJ9427957.1 MFS transporter [Kordiimonas marina]
MSIFKNGGTYDPDRGSSIAAAVLLGLSANISFIIQPGLVGGFVDALHFTEGQAGELAAYEMFGIAASTVVLAFLSLKANWRISLALCAILAAVGDFLSAKMTGFHELGIARFIAGCGHGGLISLSFAAIGLTKRTDRNLGIYLTALLSYGALGLLLMPYLLDAIGLSGIFIAFSVASLMALFSLPYMPYAPKEEAAAEVEATRINFRLLIPTLLGFLAYNISQGIVWAYLFLIGTGAGLGDQTVANSLFISQIFGVIGAFLAVIISAKVVGRFAPITAGVLGGAAFIALLMPGPSYVTYLIAVCGFNLAWNKVLPFILAAIADFDVRGRVMTFALAIQMGGLAIGPYIASQIVGEGDYFSVELSSVIFFVIGYVLLIFPIMSHSRILKAAEQG